MRKVTPRDTEPNPETFLLETPLSERAADGQPLRIVRSITPLDLASVCCVQCRGPRSNIAHNWCCTQGLYATKREIWTGRQFEALSDSKNALKGLLRVIFRSYAAGGPGIATAVIDQVLRDVYAALVLGCKMEMPGNSLMARGIS